MARRPSHPKERPTKQQILDHVEKARGQIGKREIARAFHLAGPDRVWLKQVLKELEDEGLLERQRGRKVIRAGHLPEVTVLRVSHLDDDGEVIAVPANWPDGETPPPVIYLAPSPRQKLTPGIGDRVLARLKRIDSASYEAEPIKLLGPAAQSLLGVFERDEKGQGVLNPTDRRL